MNKKQEEALKAKFSGCRGSSGMMVSTLSEWYDAKHRRPSAEEVDFVNSIPIDSCPHCGSRAVRRDGKSKKTGLIVMECKGCGRKFGPLTGTMFDSRKIPLSEWVEFLVHLFQFHSVKTSSMDNRNAESTGRYWLSKAFAVVDEIQSNIRLSGTVWIDETYFPKWRSESERDGGGRGLRGLSRNQFCVCSATDGKTCALVVCGVGKPSSAKAVKAYGRMIAAGSKIVHDGDKSHNALVSMLSLSSEVHAASDCKGMADSENPMEPINKIHRYLSGFIGSHRGFSRGELQDWLNLFCFYWNTDGDAFQKAQAFIELAVKKRSILQYRDWSKMKKHDES